MGALAANNAWGELNVALLPTTPQIVLQAGQGDRFPNAVNGVSWFFVTLADKENNLEIVRCTNRIGDTLDVERGADGTTAKEYKAGDKVELRPCAALFNDKVSTDQMETEINALKAELGKEDDTIYDRIDTEIDAITKNYATTEYVDTKIKEINKTIEDGSLTKDEAKKLYLPLAGGTLTGALAIKSDDGARPHDYGRRSHAQGCGRPQGRQPEHGRLPPCGHRNGGLADGNLGRASEEEHLALCPGHRQDTLRIHHPGVVQLEEGQLPKCGRHRPGAPEHLSRGGSPP